MVGYLLVLLVGVVVGIILEGQTSIYVELKADIDSAVSKL